MASKKKQLEQLKAARVEVLSVGNAPAHMTNTALSFIDDQIARLEAQEAQETRPVAPTSAARTSAARTSAAPTRALFATLRSTLMGAFPERERVIDALLMALVAGEHAVLLGPPGTGKSAVVRAITSAFSDATYFEVLFTRFTEPSDLFGGVDLPKWTSTGVYERRSAGMLQQATIAFGDEVFKTSASAGNCLLALMNERVFHDGGQVHKCPLRTFVGASNEMPESAELAAMFDRFLLRVNVEYVRDESAFAAVLLGSDPSVCAAGTMTLADLDAAQAESQAMPLGKDVVGSIYALRAALASEGIVVSDRRWKKCLSLLRAWAWMQGDPEVDALHFEALRDALWTDPRECPKVAAIVTKTASPVLAQATETFDAIMEQVTALPATGSIKTQGAAVGAELKKAIEAIEKLAANASPAVQSRVKPFASKLREEHGALVRRITAELGL